MDQFSEETHPIIQLIINNDLDNLKNSVEVEDLNKLYPCKDLEDYISPLSAAVVFHKMDICDFLLTEGADLDSVEGGPCPLHYACESAPVEFVSRLIKAGARTNLYDPRTGLSPFQTAALRLHDKQYVMKVLIEAGVLTTPLPPTHPQHHIINKTISELIEELGSSGEEMYSKIKLFLDLGMAITQKSPREVFEHFGRHMLEANPLNHLTVIDILFNVGGSLTEEYHQKCITWLKDNNKLNFYIENVVKQFPNMIYHFPDTIVRVLQTIFNTMEEIPSEASLALIPQLLELLSTGNKWSRIIPDVLLTLYVITQKTKGNDGWNQDFINNICTAIVPFVETNHPQMVRMYAYATLANLPFAHTSNFFTSMGIDHVPEDVIISAGMRMDGYMKVRLSELKKHLSKPTSGIETINTAPSKQPLKWNRISERWREKLEKLANANTHGDDKVIKVGNFVMGKGSEFHIAGGSDGTEVFLGLREDGTEVAVKRMTPENYELLKNEQGFLRLPELDDNSIVRYVDFIEDKNFGYLVLQLCEYTLEEYIKLGIEFPGGRLSERAIVQQVLTSLKILHQQKPPILHRDIKPQNVLIDVTKKARLADFGISRRLTRGQTTFQHSTRCAGTKCWMATETINEDGGDEHVPYKRSADIQVAGMLLYYILSGGHHPFGKDLWCEGNIFNGQYNLDLAQDAVTKDLIERMINKDPKKRPTVEECLAHPYFWGNEKRVKYLEKAGNLNEVRKYYDNPDHQKLIDVLNAYAFQYAEMELFNTWKDKMKVKLPNKVFQDMEKWRGKKRGKTGYSENGFELLRFIRNLHEHYAEAAADIDLMEMFPGLFDCVYLFVKDQGWNKLATMKDFLETTNLKDLGPASSLNDDLSKLSLQSP